jgi:putative transposase
VRSLADVELDYLYLDGTCFRYHPGARAEPVLVAYGITATGAPVFLAPAGSQGHDPCVDFLADLTTRGLRSPVLVISDGAPGLISAVEHARHPTRPSRPAHRPTYRAVTTAA